MRLVYHWIAVGSDPAVRPAERVEFPHPVRHGETIALLFHVKAPPAPGEYRLVFELLQELVVWFDVKGAPKLAVPVTVR